jgi:hypothetical protein
VSDNNDVRQIQFRIIYAIKITRVASQQNNKLKKPSYNNNTSPPPPPPEKNPYSLKVKEKKVPFYTIFPFNNMNASNVYMQCTILYMYAKKEPFFTSFSASPLLESDF